MPKYMLIAEDEAASREMLTTYAKTKGYHVVAVTNGVDLVEAASQEDFDVVITDLMMPDLNGASASEILKFQGSEVPVIALTALAHQELDLVKDKFAKIYQKPVNYCELFDYVGQLLGE